MGIWLIEIAQYVFHLGIFDVGDIIANAAGFGECKIFCVNRKKEVPSVE
ncbi:hypothetical protein [Enterococcus lactis]|nr:hypothetical protein [Enterococcus lactis]MDB7713092.1 hypothetical protein [Enterococcus faecium]